VPNKSPVIFSTSMVGLSLCMLWSESVIMCSCDYPDSKNLFAFTTTSEPVESTQSVSPKINEIATGKSGLANLL